MKQVDYEEIQRKTVRDVVEVYDGEVYISFTDETYCAIEACCVDDEYALLENGSVTVPSSKDAIEKLLNAGLITDEEAKRHLTKMEDFRIKQEQEAEAYRRRQYEELKAEFEGNL